MVTVDFPELRADSWNGAPTTPSLVVRASRARLAAEWLSWGLKDSSSGPNPINARVESATTKPSFRDAWQSRRCVVPVDGWYEWRLEDGRKQPYYFYRRDGKPT